MGIEHVREEGNAILKVTGLWEDRNILLSQSFRVVERYGHENGENKDTENVDR